MVLVYKKRYLTCLEMLNEFRVKYSEYENEVLSYTGILDPMAEGWVPVVIGKDENKNRVVYTEADKEYVVEVLVGLATDTYDLLGKIHEDMVSSEHFLDNDIRNILSKFVNYPRSFKQVVPMFSSYKYRGVPMWKWGVEDVVIAESDRKINDVKIYEIESESENVITKDELKDQVDLMLLKITGDFRQELIAKNWRKLLASSNVNMFKLIKVKMLVSKGFYVRKLIEDISREINIPMLVYSLKRTKVIMKDYEQLAKDKK